MPIYDIFCTGDECDNEVIDIILKVSEDLPVCSECGAEMSRKIQCCHFELKYDNRKDICDWDGNTTKYYDEINKQTAEGKDVVDPNAKEWT